MILYIKISIMLGIIMGCIHYTNSTNSIFSSIWYGLKIAIAWPVILIASIVAFIISFWL